jgi:hypothetical protein
MAKDVDLNLLNTFWSQAERTKWLRGYTRDLKAARPFSLDDDMDRLVCDIAYRPSVTHSLLRRYLDSARLPYRTMWIEHPGARFSARIGGHGLESELHRVGWLLHRSHPDHPGYTVVRISQPYDESGAPGVPTPLPIVHYVDPTLADAVEGVTTNLFAKGDVVEGSFAREAFDFVASPTMRMCGWGFEHDEPTDQDARRSPLFGSTSVLIESDQMNDVTRSWSTDTVVGSLAEHQIAYTRAAARVQANELPYIAAALALINEVPVVYGPPTRPRGMIRSGGTVRPYIATSVISIDIPQSRRRLKDVRARLREASDIRRAAHECRGHWRHVQQQPKTNPERWQPGFDLFGRPCFKTWIEPHMRGSAEIGFNQHLYAVTASPDG